MRHLLLVIAILWSCTVMSQEISTVKDSIAKEHAPQRLDSISTKDTLAMPSDTIQRPSPDKVNLFSRKKREKKKVKVTYKDYRVISYQRDTTYIDTTLTIDKVYKYNDVRKDMFEYMPFMNIGQRYNPLTYQVDHQMSIIPHIGMEGKHYNFVRKQDVKYYSVATPTTELFYKRGIKQGDLIDALITFNVSPQLNISLGYKAIRSLGDYKNARSGESSIKLSSNYTSRNNRYLMRFHFYDQTFDNQENGGIATNTGFDTSSSLSGTRVTESVALENASTALYTKRFFVENEYKILHKKDSLTDTSIGIKHEYNYHLKQYNFIQTQNSDFFGNAFKTSKISDDANLRTHENNLSLVYRNKRIGNLNFGVTNYSLKYYFDRVYFKENEVIPHIIDDTSWAFTGSWYKQGKHLDLKVFAQSSIVGRLSGQVLDGTVTYKINDRFKMWGRGLYTQKLPNLNVLLYQSDYLNYNWINLNKFKPQTNAKVTFGASYNKRYSIEGSYDIIDNYTYFTNPIQADTDATNSVADNTLLNTVPLQHGSLINYFKVKVKANISVGKLFLDNAFIYQRVDQSSLVLNVPKMITRNSLYLAGDVFKEAAYMQVGFTFRYFTKYYQNGYNPLLSEFYTQSNRLIGEFPRIDFFVNMRIRRARIFFAIDHLNSTSSKAFYSAYHYPYRDFAIRYGIVWDFFR